MMKHRCIYGLLTFCAINHDEETMKKIVVPFLRTPYNYDTEQASDESGLKCLDKSLAQQHMKDEVDINTIVQTFTRTGMLPQHSLPPLAEDFTQVKTFQQALDLVVEARESFQQMPAEVRNRFGNDPVAFVDYCSNPDNREEMRKWGLYSPEAAARFNAEDLDRANLIQEAKNARAAKSAAPATPGDTKKGGVT